MNHCAVCGGILEGWGSNPDPLATGDNDRCCRECDLRFVIPARILQLGPTACAIVRGVAEVGRALVDQHKLIPSHKE